MKSSEEKLRREIEILRAQIKTGKISIPQKAEESTKIKTKSDSYNLDIPKIKADIVKTYIFTVIALATLIALYLTEAKWINLIKFI